MENNAINVLPEEEATIFGDIVPNFNEASKGERFADYIVDLIGYYAFSFVIGMLLKLSGLGTSSSEFLNGGDATTFTVGIFFLYYIIFTFGVFFLYYVLWEGLTGRSLGKLITGMKVVMDDGSKPSFSTIMIRTLCRFIPFEAFSFFGKRGWHDSLSKTKVIRAR